MPSYSKAPRGLSVLMQVIRVFTDIPISPSPSSRQHFCHSAFRAGRNLPDKEFRYLRTVIVTAAVHRGFDSNLDIIAAFLLTFRHWAGVSPHTSSCDLAETCVFGKQSPGPLHCDHLAVAPLIPKLRGHFAEFLRESYLAPLGILYHPTCVGFGYRPSCLNGYRAFLGSLTSPTSLP